MSNEPRHMQQARRGRRMRLGMLVLLALAVTVVGLFVQSRRPTTVETAGAGHLTVSGRGDAPDPATASGQTRTAEMEAPPATSRPTPSTSSASPPATNQPLPSTPGIAPVISRVDTDDPVVFLTIDDGLTRLPEGLEEFEELGMPASLFLLNEPIESDPEYFRRMPGTLVESHSQTHRNMRELSEAEQREEICGNAEVIERTYGRRPVLFRPPYGNYNAATQRAAAACGMKAVVIWEENVNYDVVGFRNVPHFRPGDIILMHFRPQFVQELNVIKDRVEEAGLRFALLEDYIAPETVPPDLRR